MIFLGISLIVLFYCVNMTWERITPTKFSGKYLFKPACLAWQSDEKRSTKIFIKTFFMHLIEYWNHDRSGGV